MTNTGTGEHFREHPAEIARTADLLALIDAAAAEAGLTSALDIGARDGHFSRLMAERFGRVVALDLERPAFEAEGVECVAGDATRLAFEDGAFDLVFCAEVLEHIPSPSLERAAAEIARVAARRIVVGVPFRQDLRLGRTRCAACGGDNPPWGHVNAFDAARLVNLFPGWEVRAQTFVGSTLARTNAVSAALMSFAGHPYGTYEQDEPCIHCGAAIGGPPARSHAGRVATRVAVLLNRLQQRVMRPGANWIHVVLAPVSGAAEGR